MFKYQPAKMQANLKHLGQCSDCKLEKGSKLGHFEFLGKLIVLLLLALWLDNQFVSQVAKVGFLGCLFMSQNLQGETSWAEMCQALVMLGLPIRCDTRTICLTLSDNKDNSEQLSWSFY